MKNKGNLNNHIGLPLSLIELRTRPDVAVMELGMNHAGEISTLVAIAEPDVRVWTNVGDAHIGFFASADAIADAKAEILERADAGTLLVCNADDQRVMTRVGGFAGRTVTFGFTTDGHRARARRRGSWARRHACRRHDDAPATERSRPRCSGAAICRTCWRRWPVSLEPVSRSMRSCPAAATLSPGRPPRRRAGPCATASGWLTIPTTRVRSALGRSLECWHTTDAAARKVAVLGEMLELGDHATALHRESGRRAAEAGVDLLFVIGGAPARELARQPWRRDCRARR